MPKINAFLYWLQHVETFSYLELVTSRGDVNFVALHHSLQERPSQQRIRTRHGSVPCARCLHCTLVYTRSLRTGPRPIQTHVCLEWQKHHSNEFGLWQLDVDFNTVMLNEKNDSLENRTMLQYVLKENLHATVNIAHWALDKIRVSLCVGCLKRRSC